MKNNKKLSKNNKNILTFDYISDIVALQSMENGGSRMQEDGRMEEMKEKDEMKEYQKYKVNGSKLWVKGTKYLLDFMFFSGILATASLPWGIRWVGKQLPFLIEHYEESVIIYFVLGIAAEKLLWELRKIFQTVIAGNCFVEGNVVSLRKMGNWSFFIALMAIVRSIVYRTVAMGVVILVFLIAGLFSKVLSFVFEQAVAYKEETDWTI